MCHVCLLRLFPFLLIQLYLRRQKYLKGEVERKIWGGINELYMTEESDDIEGDGFRQHPLQWRSNG